MKSNVRAALSALALIAATAAPAAHAIETDGFKFDDRIRLGDSELVANGAGIRSKFGRRYAMALYLPAKTTDAAHAVADKGAKRIAIKLIRDVSGDTFASAVRKGINNNSSEAEQHALASRVAALEATVSAIDEIKAGSGIVFDWVPGKGTVLTIDGRQTGAVIAGEDFIAALLRVWLGEDPVQDDLKQGLLGKAG